MPYQQWKPRSFGAGDRLACPNCSKPMFLSRRSPDAEYERQTFTCPSCDHQIQRTVDVDGNTLDKSPPQERRKSSVTS